jgi:hypothetical protein
MTEPEWLECTDPQDLLDFLWGKASGRKLRLFACARCRQLWHLLTDRRSRIAVEVAEQFADHQATAAQLNEAAVAAWNARWDEVGSRVAVSTVLADDPTGKRAWKSARDLGGEDDVQQALLAAAGKQVPTLRDLFGNPFRPIPTNPSWLTPTVVSLAQAAYDERTLPSGELDSVRLAILADALEEAGCDNADILAHCRRPGRHTRGCFVVDALLCKT